MIDGSGLPRESFVVTGPVTVKPVEKQEVAVLIRYGVGAPEVYATELEGTLVKLPAGQIEVPAQNGTKGFSLASGWTMAGHDGAAIEIYQGTSSGPSRTATMVSSGGGQTLGMGATSSSGHQISVLAGPVAIAAVTAEICMYYSWKYMGYPRVGYVWPGPYYGQGLSACLAAGTATAEFVKKPELTLEVTVEGGGSPKCAGYVQATNARKYYSPGAEVMLIATAFKGYRFSHWEGDGTAWVKDSSADPYSGSGDPLKGHTEDEVFIKISGSAEAPQVREATAVFVPDRVLVVVLSGEIWFSSPEPEDIDCGLFDWANTLDPSLYDVNLFDEDGVESNGSGAVFNFLKDAINAGVGRRIAIVGYSHGGGSTHDLCARLHGDPNEEIEDTFRIIMTGYVDAIRNLDAVETTPETRLPPSSQAHVNLYQRYHDSWLWGAAVAGSVPNWDVNVALECVENQSHSKIDYCLIVYSILTDHLNRRTLGTCHVLSSDYCDGELVCNQVRMIPTERERSVLCGDCMD